MAAMLSVNFFMLRPAFYKASRFQLSRARTCSLIQA